MAEVELSFCIVNTEQRELLLRCLDAVAREQATTEVASEVLVLDNASLDGSAAAARNHGATDEVIALKRRRGKGANDSALLQRSRGRYCLLLNEDSELMPGAVRTLLDELDARPGSAAAGARLLRPDGVQQPSAWRFPSPRTALAGAFFAHARMTVQSRGPKTREVDWVQSAAMLVRRDAAEQIDWFDPAFFVYSDEVDFCKRLRDAGWTILYVPGAACVHHEQLMTGNVPERRIVEFARNRDLYMRKHHGTGPARTVRWLTAWAYLLRTLAALVLPGHDAKRYWRHVTASLYPSRGEGVREAASDFNLGGRRL